MSFSQAIAYCFKNYAKFNGRASRSEFWYFYLFNVLVAGVPAIIGSVLMAVGTTSAVDMDGMTTTTLGALGIFGIIVLVLSGLISLALLIPNIAVACRRLHDRGTSGWLLLLALVPCGSLVLFIFWLLESQGPNSFGEGPATA